MVANHAILVLSLAGFARASVTVSSQFTNTHALSDSECYAPTDEGARGSFGPSRTGCRAPRPLGASSPRGPDATFAA